MIGGDMIRNMVLILVFASMAIIYSENVYADGGYFYNVGVNTEEVDNDAMGGQQAFLLKTSDSFTLYLQSSVQGNLADFSWVLPLPVEPDEIEEAPEKLFQLLNDFTAPQVVQYEVKKHESNSGWCLGGVDSENSAGGDSNSSVGEDKDQGLVEVLTSGVVGDFSYEVIKSEKENALVNWLDENGYYLPSNAENIIKHYVDNEFVFLAAKIKRDVEGDNKVNSLPALEIKFPKDTEMVFPMRITSLSTRSKVPVLIYAAAKEEEPILSPETEWQEKTRKIQTVCNAGDYKVAVQDRIDSDSNNIVLQSRHYFEAIEEDWPSYYYDPAIWKIRSFSFECKDSMGYYDSDYLFEEELDFDNYDGDSVVLMKNLIEENYVLVRWYTELASEEMDEDIYLVTKAMDADYSNYNRVSYTNVNKCGSGCQQVPEPFFALLIVLLIAVGRRNYSNS